MISVGRIIEGAFGLIRDHFTAVAIWAGVYLAGNVAILLAVQPIMAQAFGAGSMADPSRMMGAMLPIYGMNIILALIGIVLYAAGMRAILRPASGGLGFLRVGMDELRILLLMLIFIVVGTIVSVGFVLLMTLLGAGIAIGSESPVMTVLLGFLLGLGVFALFLFLVVRFSLAFPLTLHRRHIVIGEAWTLSKGRFWTLFGAAFVVTIIGFVLTMVVGIFAAGSYIGDLMAASGNPEVAAAAAERQLQAVGALGPAMIVQTLAGSVIGAVWIALSAGSTATAAKLLLEDEFDDAEAVFG